MHPLNLCSAAQDNHFLKIAPVQEKVSSTRINIEQQKVLKLPL